MAGLGRTIGELARRKELWTKMLASADALRSRPDHAPGAGRLREVTGFGSNPGNLRMLTYLPQAIPDRPALVVVLHGCTQAAAAYDHGAGWSTVADRYGFALLFPEQQRANNPKTCFNWFLPGDIARDRGEALSIRQMVERMVRDHGVDRGRIFVTGLSAGGAMTAVMLATYPEVFAGGAIIAGLPFGAAAGVPEAFDAMFKGRTRPAREWGDLVRAASPHGGPWPRLSVWHGSADTTVQPMNAGEIVKQWTDLHGLPTRPDREERVDGFPRRVWRNQAGQDVIEEYTITGMAHGTPLATGAGDDRFGAAGPFLLEAGISSSYHIAKFWGLTAAHAGAMPRAAAVTGTVNAPGIPADRPRHDEIRTREPRPTFGAGGRASGKRPGDEPRGSPGIDVGGVIAKALRAAGLMK